MAHSKNGHNKLRGWERLNRRRSLARCKAKVQVLDEYEQEMVALDEELRQELEDWFYNEEEFDLQEELEDHFDELHRDWYEYELEDNRYEVEPRSFDRELDFDIFTAVDRAVRRHGLENTRKQAHLLAAAFDVSVWEIEDCIKHTRAGYING